MKFEAPTSTYQTRLHLTVEQEAILNDYAELMSHVERKLFAEFSAKKNLNDLKTQFLCRFRITARQFNACRVQVEGKIDSIKKRRVAKIEEDKNYIQELEKKIQKLEKQKKATSLIIHKKKRRLHTLQCRLDNLISDHTKGVVRLCFGSKKLFRSQFNLNANELESHEEWKSQWQQIRNQSFFLLGSKDETAGNQSCSVTIDDDSLSLRLRLPNALNEHGKYLNISNIQFKYGHDVILANLQNCLARKQLAKIKDPHYKEFGQALSYRFKRDEKGWILFVSGSLAEPKWVTRKGLGSIGIDINANHLAIVETDRFGNPIKNRNIALNTYGKNSNQTKALIGDAVAELVQWSICSQKPIVIEKLDFQKKKTELKEKGYAKYSRMLSSFSYSTIINYIKSRAWRFGVEVEEVNPAFTSIIGRVKFAKRYGLTVHESAALCIARRFQGVSERLPRCLDKIPDGKGDHVALSLPVRNRDKHVWSLWGLVKKRLSVVLAAHFRAIKKRSSSRPPPACCDREFLSDIVGEIPTHESSVALLD